MNEKAMIIYLHTEGLFFTQIAKQLDLSVNTVKSFYNRNKDKQFCLFCGASIEQPPRTRLKKFCSDKCRIESWKISKDNKFGNIEKTCRYCGCHFLSYVSKDAKYCSRKCYLNDVRKEVPEYE